MDTLFADVSKHLATESAKKESIQECTRELDELVRQLQSYLHSLHTPNVNAAQICQSVNAQLEKIGIVYNKIGDLVSAEEYYRYVDMWKWSVSQVCFAAVTAHWVSSGKTLTIAEIMGLLQVKSGSVFRVEIEEYLHGLCNMSNELSRLCVNCVTRGDFETPKKISAFVGELYAGFRLLNLKNDSLRRRFDSLKYDVKKIEEVVYDITIRSLKNE